MRKDQNHKPNKSQGQKVDRIAKNSLQNTTQLQMITIISYKSNDFF